MKNQIDQMIGKNIRQIRKIRGITLSALADRYSEKSGEIVSSGLIGSWERNEKRISASQLYFIAQALECSVDRLYDQDLEKPLEDVLRRIYQELKDLPEDEFKMIYHTAVEWKGNIHALIHSVGMYSSMNRKDRSEVAFMCLNQYEKAKAAERLLPDAVSCDPAFIEKEWIRLLKKEKKEEP